MKQLKFKPELCELILSGEKTATWRFFDDKDLTVGDEVEFFNSETGEVIGSAKITGTRLKTLGTLGTSDWVGHETYKSEAEMYDTYRGYYGDKIGPDTEFQIITFTFEPKI